MIKVGDEKKPTLSQNPIFRQKWGTPPPNEPKIHPSQIELKFPGKASRNKWSRLVMKKITPPPSQNSILGKKEGEPPQIRQKFNQLGFCLNF